MYSPVILTATFERERSGRAQHSQSTENNKLVKAGS